MGDLSITDDRQNTPKKSINFKGGTAQSVSVGLTHPFSSYLAGIHMKAETNTHIRTHLSDYPCNDLLPV